MGAFWAVLVISYGVMAGAIRVLGVLGGRSMAPAQVADWCASADCIIAADSGLFNVLEAGFVPDILAGDFDSVPQEMRERFESLDLSDDQDTTDCQKLLGLVKNFGYESVTLIGTEGDLVDHMLDTIHSATRVDLRVRVGLIRGTAYILRGPQNFNVTSKEGKRVSMLPIENAVGCSLAGVQWPFEGRELSPSGFTSISNQALCGSVQASIESGSVYLFVESDGSAIWE